MLRQHSWYAMSKQAHVAAVPATKWVVAQEAAGGGRACMWRVRLDPHAWGK